MHFSSPKCCLAQKQKDAERFNVFQALTGVFPEHSLTSLNAHAGPCRPVPARAGLWDVGMLFFSS